VIKVLFTGRWIVTCAIHRWIILLGQIEWNYGNMSSLYQQFSSALPRKIVGTMGTMKVLLPSYPGNKCILLHLRTMINLVNMYIKLQKHVGFNISVFVVGSLMWKCRVNEKSLKPQLILIVSTLHQVCLLTISYTSEN
jgi:hypothetical protein